MEIEAFEQTLSLQKTEMEVFVKIPVIGKVVNKFKKCNEILQPNILIDFKAIFNVMQRILIVRNCGDGQF